MVVRAQEGQSWNNQSQPSWDNSSSQQSWDQQTPQFPGTEQPGRWRQEGKGAVWFAWLRSVC